MSLPHYFLETQVLSRETGENFELLLSKEDAKHARVARLSAGEHLAVIDAEQDYFHCQVVDFSGNLPIVRIAQKIESQQEQPAITLVQGLAKGEKMELVIRHGTELGVCSFIPLKCERSIMKLDPKKAGERIKRWNAIAKSAAMQSGQHFIATVQDQHSIGQLSARASEFDAIFVCWEEADQVYSLKRALTHLREVTPERFPAPRIALVVGPEGGLSEREVQALLDSHPRAQLVSLGSSILRTETAGIVAPALVLYELGLLGGAC